MRRSGIGEVVSASIILAATAVVAALMLAGFSEQAQVAADDIRSRIDIMRGQAVEQLDVTSREWRPGGNLTFLVTNYGEYDSAMPFLLYREDGSEVTNHTVRYYRLNDTDTPIMFCTTAAPCTPYNMTLPRKDLVRLEMPWPANDPLIIITDSGRALWAGSD